MDRPAQNAGITDRLERVSTAIYRRYRPQTFQEVIGQNHVTQPLMAALEAGRTTHAYLFSGPRGCGKTTSARILARCLNCAEYPTDTPCGKCDSCVELARDGSGSLDVVELDAASHGGVDDARELREQAGFAPVRDRYKVFIIDEAHMVSNQGFNALLKLVEEPPEHVKFIFATTEPEKVIGTIRSRTHHYPFRLVPPSNLEDYLAELCEAEGVSAGKDVLSLVVRAGTGSVRDTLSVLDQIIGGSEGSVLDYERAVSLLGYTSATLLDDAVRAVAEQDGAALFGVVDSVVKSGHDPRRFVEDLLQRLRDLVIISLAGDSAHDVFVSVPEDQYARMVQQASALGAARASRCADLTNDALTAMVGATAPRLQLELLCARLIVSQRAPEQVAAPADTPAPPPESLSKFRKPAGPAAGVQPSISQDAERADKSAGEGKVSDRKPSDAPAQRMNAKPSAQTDPRSRPMPAFPATAPETPATAAEVPATAPEAQAQQASSAKIVQSAESPDDSQAEAIAEATEPEKDFSTVAQDKKPITPSDDEQEIERKVSKSEPEPGSKSGSEPQAGATPAAARPGNDDLEKIQSNWQAILESGEIGNLALGQLNSSQGPVELTDGVLYVAFPMPVIADRFNQRNGGDSVTTAIKKVVGLEVRVEGRGTDAAPKAEAAPAAAVAGQREPAAPAAPAEPSHVGQQYPTATQRPTAETPLPQEPDDGLDEPIEPETDPVYQDDSPRNDDPAGVLAKLLDGTATIIGEDNTKTATSVPDSESGPEPVEPEHDEPEPIEPDPVEPDLEEPDQHESDQYESDLDEPRTTPNPEPEGSEPFYAQQMPTPPPATPPEGLTTSQSFPQPPPMAAPNGYGQQVKSAWTPGGVDRRRRENETNESSERIAEQSESSEANVPDVASVDKPRTLRAVPESEWDEVSMDDPEISQSDLVGIQVVLNRFDAKVIEEIPNSQGR